MVMMLGFGMGFLLMVMRSGSSSGESSAVTGRSVAQPIVVQLRHTGIMLA